MALRGILETVSVVDMLCRTVFCILEPMAFISYMKGKKI